MHPKHLQSAIVCGLLIVCTTAAYSSVVTADFVNYDDNIYVYENKSVLQGLSWSGLTYAFSSSEGGIWLPVTWLSLELDASLWGSKAPGYHVTNLILHIANSLVLFVVFRSMTGSIYRSAFVAGLFALHPLHVESVAWVSERKDVLSALFLLGCIAAYVRYANRPSFVSYCILILVYLAGLFAKPMLVTLPVLLALIDYWPLNRIKDFRSQPEKESFPPTSIGQIAVEKIPLLVIAFLMGLLTLQTQRLGESALKDLTWAIRVGNMLNAYLWYLQKTFVPMGLIPIYLHPAENVSWSWAGCGLLILLVVSLTAVALGRKRPYLLVGWAWFVISLLPVIGLIQTGIQSYADRYAYIPHIGLFIALVWGTNALLGRARWMRPIEAILAACVLSIFGWQTYTQAAHWKDSKTLWHYALQIEPNNALVHDHLAELYYEEFDFESAARHFAGFLQGRWKILNPRGLLAWGWSLSQLNRLSEAEEKYREFLEYERWDEHGLRLLIDILEKQGKKNEVKPFRERLIEIERYNQQFGGELDQGNPANR